MKNDRIHSLMKLAAAINTGAVKRVLSSPARREIATAAELRTVAEQNARAAREAADPEMAARQRAMIAEMNAGYEAANARNAKFDQDALARELSENAAIRKAGKAAAAVGTTGAIAATTGKTKPDPTKPVEATPKIAVK